MHVTIEGGQFSRFSDRHRQTLQSLTLITPCLVHESSSDSWIEYAKVLQSRTQLKDFNVIGDLCSASKFPINTDYLFKQPDTQATVPVNRILRFLLCGKKHCSQWQEDTAGTNLDREALLDWDTLRFEDIKAGRWTRDDNGNVINLMMT